MKTEPCRQISSKACSSTPRVFPRTLGVTPNNIWLDAPHAPLTSRESACQHYSLVLLHSTVGYTRIGTAKPAPVKRRKSNVSNDGQAYLYILTSQCSEVKASSRCSNLMFLFPISAFLVRSNPGGERKSSWRSPNLCDATTRWLTGARTASTANKVALFAVVSPRLSLARRLSALETRIWRSERNVSTLEWAAWAALPVNFCLWWTQRRPAELSRRHWYSGDSCFSKFPAPPDDQTSHAMCGPRPESSTRPQLFALL